MVAKFYMRDYLVHLSFVSCSFDMPYLLMSFLVLEENSHFHQVIVAHGNSEFITQLFGILWLFVVHVWLCGYMMLSVVI